MLFWLGLSILFNILLTIALVLALHSKPELQPLKLENIQKQKVWTDKDFAKLIIKH